MNAPSVHMLLKVTRYKETVAKERSPFKTNYQQLQLLLTGEDDFNFR